MDRTTATNYVLNSAGKRVFRDRNLAAGLPGTQLVAADLIAHQEEILAVIEGAGLTPDPANLAQLLAAILLLTGKNYTWNLSSPPSSDVLLLPRDRATINFTGVSTIPLKIQTVQPGRYTIKAFIDVDNTTNADISLRPNNTTYTNAFSFWVTANTDTNISGLGNATSGVTGTVSTVSPYVGNLPLSSGAIAARNDFYHDLFAGPSGSDNLNDIGPWLMEWLCNTGTTSKIVRGLGAIAGGTSGSFSKWNDTTTLWTSLGTIVDPNATAMSGTVIVERLA